MTACYYGETEVAEDDETGEMAVTDTLVEEEFDTTLMATCYKAWDVDDGILLGEGEFTTSFFQLWDTDEDNQI